MWDSFQKYLPLKLAWVIIINWVQHFVKLFYVGLFSKILVTETGLLDYHKLSSTFCKVFYVGLFSKILVTETGLLDYHKLSSTFAKLFYVGFFSKTLVTQTGLRDYHKSISIFFKALSCKNRQKFKYYSNSKNCKKDNFLKDLKSKDFSSSEPKLWYPKRTFS